VASTAIVLSCAGELAVHAGTVEITKTVEQASYGVKWSGRTIHLSNIVINGKRARPYCVRVEDVVW
jgi:hypothetical protein